MAPIVSIILIAINGPTIWDAETSQDKIANFEMKLMDIDNEHLGIPEAEYHAIVNMPSGGHGKQCLMAIKTMVKLDKALVEPGSGQHNRRQKIQAASKTFSDQAFPGSFLTAVAFSTSPSVTSIGKVTQLRMPWLEWLRKGAPTTSTRPVMTSRVELGALWSLTMRGLVSSKLPPPPLWICSVWAFGFVLVLGI
ncbi:uncharacterized protein LOC131234639 [Magnolia sinica]|uniref:uncharacterized protein LOC131234639 n=1 Tax=Magnolia sinica TaxID=86752 RepID=UPI002657E0D6|nr:uncharacterized protein LOC131234639 [Magnolia sinica]